MKIKLILLVQFFTISNAFLAQNKTDSIEIEKQYTIENCVTEFSMDETSKTNVGYQFWFVNKDFIDGQTLKLSVVNPKSSTHSPHKHIEDEFFFILEGKAEFYLDGKTKIISPYTSLYCPSNVEHGIKNVGDTELKYLVMKKYKK